MSVIGGKADTRELPSGCPLIAKSGSQARPQGIPRSLTLHLGFVLRLWSMAASNANRRCVAGAFPQTSLGRARTGLSIQISRGKLTMLRSAAILLAAMALLCQLHGLASAQGPVEDALEGCSNELKTYCSAVTPGGGRLVSCAKAHEDKLSPECISAINRAGYWVQFIASTLRYVVTQCKADALKYCPDVELGEERVLNCLASNRAELSKYCGLALEDIGK